jgi:hypothetical protein
MAEKDEEKGFTVRDRRLFAEGKSKTHKKGAKTGDGPHEEERKTEGKQEKEQERAQETPLPEINFSNFIFSFSTSVLIQLGEIADPVSNTPQKNLPVAKQTIDILGILQEKTKGNLTPDEETLIQNILYDLRMRYVKARE